MKHGERLFLFKENQTIWDAYLNNIMVEWDAENRKRLQNQTYTEEEKEEKIKKLSGYSYKGKDALTPYKYEFRRKKQSVQQYKPIILEFEEYVEKSFNEVTAKDMENFSKITKKANKLNHFNAFFRDCVSSGLIKNRDKNFLISLLPEGYKSIGQMIVEDEDRELPAETKGMMRCSFCGRFKEASADNWILIQRNGEAEMYLACKGCEGSDGEYKF